MKKETSGAGSDIVAQVVEAEVRRDDEAVDAILKGLDARDGLYACVRALRDARVAVTGTPDEMRTALEALAPVIENPPKEPDLFQVFLVRVARLATRLGNHAEASRVVRLLESIAPEGACRPEILALVCSCRAEVLQLAGKYPESMAMFSRALELVGDRRDRLWFSMKVGRLVAAVILRDIQAAERDLADLESLPEDVLGHFPGVLAYHRSQVLNAANRWVEALAVLDGAFPKPPEPAMHRRLWATDRTRLLIFCQRVEEGLRFLEEHRDVILPFNREILMAFAAMARGRLEETRRHVRAAFTARTTRPRDFTFATLFLAAVELSERNARAARLLLRNIDPDEKNPLYAMEWCRLCALEGDERRAAAHLKTALRDRTVSGMAGPMHGVAEMSLEQFARLMVLASGGGPPERQGRGQNDAVGAAAAASGRRPVPLALVGESPAMLRVRADLARFAPLEETVLITGETGTGKELVARLLHDGSPNAKESFLAVNCGAISDALLESELFGHVKGAFTGATADHDGLLVAAGRGTIFFDEVDSMSPRVQASLLRVLEERRVRPVGSTASKPFRARVLAAGGPGLAEGVPAEGFRSDLYFRLARLRIHLPPLRERPEDIPLLAAHFLMEHFDYGAVALGDDLLDALRRHPWPGNVRELRNEVQRIAIFSGGAKVLGAELFAAAESAEPAALRPAPAAAPAGPRNSRGRRAALRDLFRKRGELSRGEASLLLSVAPITAAKDLEALRAEGLIERVEPTRSPRTHYFRLRG